ncbi:SMP-30/gluconolactonase/LRE family protein [Aurantiacibacter spongiae]|uniref:SMP-30/gluconolactonase/LRE family protein n=1 Tax=Aurantiacibacter spongiae TaxID=2488860 RepID=A0A3N5CZK5_9SPHN|nr:SMP-30/gluconolactonase/LRE family protein [Aurantiacibacter spongiae]RPF72159.1 SMP-30/gluconolactonase/LRE family protein [Aurantiacibacter spongiae]
MIGRRTFLGSLALAPLAGCVHPGSAPRYPRVGGIERLDARLDAIVDADAPVEQLATGYTWAEGPVWVSDGGFLLFTDPGNNVIHRWTPGIGAAPFLTPSGLAGPIPAGVREAGANGLRIDDRGRLVMADSGTRTIARMDLATREKVVLAATYEGQRFNSPNDLTLSRSGAIYFTDPPYGFSQADESPLREVPFNGLYRIAPGGDVALLDGSHRRPNGVALSPDERTLYLALSDEERPQVLAYDLDANGMPTGSRLFLDMQSGLAAGLPGLPDGVKVDRTGNVFATGPGGVHVTTPRGEVLGIIATGKAVANCAFGGSDGRTLFLTSHDMLARVRLKARG